MNPEKIFSKQGLIDVDIQQFGDLLKKANIPQLLVMVSNINAEIEMRSERQWQTI